MVEQGIVALLAAANTLAGDRIRPLQLDRDPVLPAITYQRISTPREVEHDGDQGYADFRVQLNCWAQRTTNDAGYGQARQLANEVRAALHGYRGTAAGVVIGLIEVSGDRDETDPERHFERVLLEAHGNYLEA